MQTSTNTDDRILRLPEVTNLTGLSKSGVYQAIQDNNFPKPLKLGKRASGWLASDVTSWIADLVKQRGEA